MPEINEKEALFNDVVSRVELDGYQLFTIPGAENQFLIYDQLLPIGEIYAGYEGDTISSVYIRDDKSKITTEINSMSDYEKVADEMYKDTVTAQNRAEEATFVDDEPSSAQITDEGDVPFDVATEQALEEERLTSTRTESSLEEELIASPYEELQADLVDRGYALDLNDDGFVANYGYKTVETYYENGEQSVEEARAFFMAEADKADIERRAFKDFLEENKDGYHTYTGEVEYLDNGNNISKVLVMEKDDLEKFVIDNEIFADSKEEYSKMVYEKLCENAKAEFLESWQDGFGVADEDGHSKILSANGLEPFMEENGIVAATPAGLVQKMTNALAQELDKEINKPIKGQEIIDQFKKDVEELNNSNKENVSMEENKNSLDINADMSEKEMAQAAMDYINGGQEMTQDQKDFVDSFDKPEKNDRFKILDEIDSLEKSRELLIEDIKNDEKENERLSRQLFNQIAIAKMNNCPPDVVQSMQETANQISKNNTVLNNTRFNLVEVEREIEFKKAEYKEALKGERREALHGAFSKMHDTLKQGVALGLGAMGKMKEAVEKVNSKHMDNKETKNRIADYKALENQINAINLEYCNKMDIIKQEYTLNKEDLTDLESTFKKRAELRGAIRDVGRLLTGKEAHHEAEYTKGELSEMNRLKTYISQNLHDMDELNIKYERTIAPKLEERVDFEERGKKVEDIFSARLNRIHQENEKMANKMLDKTKELVSGKSAPSGTEAKAAGDER